jgi:hypothetical protein
MAIGEGDETMLALRMAMQHYLCGLVTPALKAPRPAFAPIGRMNSPCPQLLLRLPQAAQILSVLRQALASRSKSEKAHANLGSRSRAGGDQESRKRQTTGGRIWRSVPGACCA